MAFIGTRRNGLSFLCRSEKQVSKQFTHSSATHSAMEDDTAYLVRRRISLFSSVFYYAYVFSLALFSLFLMVVGWGLFVVACLFGFWGA